MIKKQVPIKCKFCQKETGFIEVDDIKATMENELSDLGQHLAGNKKVLSELDVPEHTVGMMPSEIENRKEDLNAQNFNTRSRIMAIEHDLSTLHIPDHEEEILNQGINDSRCDECLIDKGSLKDEIATEEKAKEKAESKKHLENILAEHAKEKEINSKPEIKQ